VTSQRVRIVGKLGAVTTVSYASTYYLPAILAEDVARDLGTPASIVFLAFSAALLVAAVLGPFAGRWVDRFGGRSVLMTGSLGFSAGLLCLAACDNSVMLVLAWLVIGAAMAAGSIDVSYATLVRIHGTTARSLITGITLVAGFASTIGWLTTGWLNGAIGWRWTCVAWAAVNLVSALPVILTLPRASAMPPATSPVPTSPRSPAAAADPPQPTGRLTSWLLAYVFGVTWFVGTAMAAHLPNVLITSGASVASAIAIASLLGPSQVLGRMMEFSLLKNVSPVLSARVASLSHSAGAVLLLVIGGPAAMVFALLHGMGNGVMTVANGTLPLYVYGAAGYGARQGLLMIPARFAQALAPYAFGIALKAFGTSALWISISLGVSTLLALLYVKTARK
jgi:MFS family permease